MVVRHANSSSGGVLVCLGEPSVHASEAVGQAQQAALPEPPAAQAVGTETQLTTRLQPESSPRPAVPASAPLESKHQMALNDLYGFTKEARLADAYDMSMMQNFLVDTVVELVAIICIQRHII